jgi:hypothetical protein
VWRKHQPEVPSYPASQVPVIGLLQSLFPVNLI